MRSGDFNIDDAVPVSDSLRDEIMPLDALMPDLPRIEIEGELAEDRVRHGNPIQTELPSGLARIFNKKSEFLAVAAIENGWAHPRVVLTSRTSAEPRKPH